MRYLIVLVFILFSPLIGGIYGALYDQLTFSVSPEFFYNVRSLDPTAASPRWEVAKIGFSYTWGIGLFLGTLLSFAGLFQESAKAHKIVTLQSYLIALSFAFLFALLAWLMPCTDTDPQLNDVKDPQAFLCVMRMNNYTKVGGILGMIFGLLWQVWRYKKTVRKK